jgi:ElaB/YqjD/DUF883 family membrane-anchored ribosome-binding protein
MNTENNTYETEQQQMAGEPGSDSTAAQRILERGAEVYGQAEETVSEVYDKTARTVNKTYAQAKNYSNENPGRAIFIALGIGVGLGLLLGASSYRSRSSRIAEPVVNALSDIALAYFR